MKKTRVIVSAKDLLAYVAEGSPYMIQGPGQMPILPLEMVMVEEARLQEFRKSYADLCRRLPEPLTGLVVKESR